MRELSLFSGAGGGLLGTKLLGFTHIGYVEHDKYCQQVIAQRIKDGFLDEAPIFSDVREFTHIAKEYRGYADLVTAGFPCQPFSVTGKQQGENDEKNMWPSAISIIRAVRPQRVLLENVPGLLNFKYIQRIFGDLAEIGYDSRWCCLSAAELGAEHVRDRLWVLAYPNGSHVETRGVPIRVFQKYPHTSDTRWGKDKPRVDRAANGMASQMDRLKAIGNGQVPGVVQAAWKILNQ